jgi:SAM-dependent methyltransferase
VPLAASDLRALAVRSGALAAYVSLGVVEHDPTGPDAILAEARRVLAPGGALVISVPYVNGLRRLGAPWISRRQAALARHGAQFYQYAFSRRELLAALARHGFTPLVARPYDPARVLRAGLRAVRGACREAAVPVGDARPPSPAARSGGGIKALARRTLYSEPALRLLGHMLLVVAHRA